MKIKIQQKENRTYLTIINFIALFVEFVSGSFFLNPLRIIANQNLKGNFNAAEVITFFYLMKNCGSVTMGGIVSYYKNISAIFI